MPQMDTLQIGRTRASQVHIKAGAYTRPLFGSA
jgi:hypothetical protein